MKKLCLLIVCLILPQSVTADEKSLAQSLRYLQQGQIQIKNGNIQAGVRLYQQAVKTTPNNPEANYYYGDGLIRLGKRKEGVKYVEKAISLAPKRVDLRMAAATLYRLAGDYRRSIEEYREILRLQPKGKMAEQATKAMTLVMATRHRNNGDYESAIFLLSDLLDQYPKDLEIMVQIATSYQAAGDIKKAEKVFRLMKKIYPKDLTVRMQFARMYQENKMISKAQKEYMEIVNMDPKGIMGKQAALSIGMYDADKLKKEGKYVEALRIYKEALKMLPNDKIALFNIATTAQFLGKKQEARRAYERYLKIEPNDTQALYNLSRLFVDMGAVEPAVKILERIIKISPDSETGHLAQRSMERLLTMRSSAAIKNRDFSKGLADIDRVLKVDPENIDNRIKRGRMLINTLQFTKAKKELESVLEKDPKNMNAMYFLALAYENLGLTSESEVMYVKINKMDQTSELAHQATNRLVTLSAKRLFNEGKLELAKKEFEHIIKTDKKNHQAHFYLALIHQRNNDLVKTAKEYEKVIELDPNNVSARFNLAAIYESLNREEKALTEYRRVVSKGRNREISAVAKKRLNIVESRVNGFTFGLNYGMTTDDNYNLGSEEPRRLGSGSDFMVLVRPVSELRSDFDLSSAYRRKFGSRFRAGAQYNANFQILHRQGVDIFRNSVSPYVMFGEYSKNLGMTLTMDRSKTLSASDRKDLEFSGDRNIAKTLRIDNIYRFSRKPFLSWLARSKTNDLISSRLNLFLAAVDFDVRLGTRYALVEAEPEPILVPIPNFDFFSARVYGGGLSLQQNIKPGYASQFAYSYQNVVPKAFAGRDYANTSHTLNAKWERLLFFGIVGSLDYQLTARFYKYPDSGLLLDANIRKKRFSLYNALTASLAYQYHPSMTMELGFTGSLNSSNLDTRCTVLADRNAIVTNLCTLPGGTEGLIQLDGSAPNGNLGDFSKYTFYLRANLSFR